MITKILEWVNHIKSDSRFSVDDIRLDQANQWQYENGVIHHVSNRFFKVVGINFTPPNGTSITTPLLEQREIGTLGFIWRKDNNQPELLVHAKIEPGNVGIVQLAPSCQATASNSDRVHGGKASPYSDIFGTSQIELISSSLQSEQGSRFLGKLNRNVLASLNTDEYKHSSIHKWIPVDTVLQMLKFDYLINTDARSVLACSDWGKLVDRTPFTVGSSSLSGEFSTSFNTQGHFETVENTKLRINNMRQDVNYPNEIPLSELTNYQMNDFGIFPNKKSPFFIKFIEVKTKYREVNSWNQPIIQSTGPGKVDLIFARIDGIIHFLFKPIIEPGLLNKVELGPSVVIEPGENWPEQNDDENKGTVIIQTWQSDEGGRFFRDKSLYRIVDMGTAYAVPDGWVWLTLNQISTFLKEGGWLTNEARSALSLLLTWV